MKLYPAPQRPFYTYLPFHPHLLPGPLRLFIFGLLRGKMGKDAFLARLSRLCPEVDRADDLLHKKSPVQKPTPVYITHDVDTAEGFAAIPALSRIEDQCGVASTWFIVGDHFPLDYELLDKLVENGAALGLHGAIHDHRLAYLPPAKIKERLESCRGLIERYNIKIFRTPALLTSEALFAVLSEYFENDSSVLAHGPGREEGVQTYRPYKINKLTEYPITMPLDDTMRLEGFDWPEIYKIYEKRIKEIRRWQGQAVLATHAEPHLATTPKALTAYKKFLKRLAAKPEYELKVF